MAREIVTYTWCDNQHHEERRPARSFHVTIDGIEGDLDLCDEDNERLLTPLVALLHVVGAKPLRQPPAAPVAAAKPATKRRKCFLCDVTVTTGTDLNRHSLTRHGLTSADLYGTDCPLCGAEWNTYQALTIHGSSAHGHMIGELFREADAAGDEFDVCKEARERARLAGEEIEVRRTG